MVYQERGLKADIQRLDLGLNGFSWTKEDRTATKRLALVQSDGLHPEQP